MKRYIELETQSYIDLHPEKSIYVTESSLDEFKDAQAEKLKCASTYIISAREVGFDEIYNHIIQIIDNETHNPSPDTDDYLEYVINTFDDAFENSEKTKDLWDYVRFANKRDEDVDNYLASQGLI